MTPLGKAVFAAKSALKPDSSQPISLKEIVRPILPQLDRVEDRLKSIGQESEGILKESSRYVLCGGGKRLRAALVLFCSSVSERASHIESSALEIAAAVELIHSATLVHDDIIDRAVLRRLKPTVNVQFGEEVAVLLGDFLYARAFEMIAKVGNDKITAWMAETTQKMCEGELDQLRNRYRAQLSLQEYVSFIERKTAALISVCAQSGARLAGLSPLEESALACFGLNMGIAFQIIDDLLDLVGFENKIGKTLHTDVGNGKMTLPLILLISKLDGLQRKDLIQKLESPPTDWKQIQPLLKTHHIAAETERFADNYSGRANQALQIFDPSIRIPLENLSRFVLARDY